MKTQDKTYQGILTMVVGFVVLFFIFKKMALLYIAAGVGLPAIFFPSLATLINKYWLKLAMLLGAINSKILLTLIFFLFLTPLSFFYRLLNKDTLQLKKNTAKNSYFVDRKHTYTKEDLEKMW
jgi:hypothetical protein